MGVSSKEKAELVAYQLKWVMKIWYEQWVEERGLGVSQIEWEEFKGTFLDQFLKLELREDKVQDIHQPQARAHEYEREFSQVH